MQKNRHILIISILFLVYGILDFASFSIDIADLRFRFPTFAILIPIGIGLMKGKAWSWYAALFIALLSALTAVIFVFLLTTVPDGEALSGMVLCSFPFELTRTALTLYTGVSFLFSLYVFIVLIRRNARELFRATS
ncbi:MAG: hypothetical protein GXO82_07065 [Chlorobi bacterium]|nr:hypothetical protein [Chlorobiota bacterium]